MSQTKKSAPAKKVTKSKALPKMPAAKKPVSKASQTAKKPAKKLTLAEMQKALSSLETRMKRADTLTRKSVKTLEEVVSTLDARTKKQATAQKSALSRRVGKLSNDLEEGMATTRAEIRSALTSALVNPSSVETAVNQAISKLENNETKQAQAIAKINRHLASLAKAVEDRIVKDQMAATEALHAVETRLSTRLEAIEADSANALTQIGDKVATLSEAIEERQARADSVVALKISELAAQTQAEFDKTSNSMEERLEKLEQAEREAALVRPQSLSNDMSANVSTLSGQVETLQSRLDNIDASFTALQTQTEMMAQDLQRAQWQLEQNTQSQTVYTPVPDAHIIAPAPVQAPVQTAVHAPTNVVNFTPQTLKPSVNPYAEMSGASQETMQAPVNDQPDHFPVEFDPTAFSQPNTATAYAQSELAVQAQPNPDMITAPPPLMGGVDATPQAYVSPGNNLEDLPAGDPILPYADPAYAENEEHMDRLRIADDTKSKKRRSKKPKAKKVKKPKAAKGEGSSLLTPRNLRVAALATGVAVVGLFAAKSFLSPQTAPMLVGNGEPSIAQSPNGPTQGGLVQDGPVQGGPNQVAPQTSAPIGQYAETSAPVLSVSSAGTIEAAAAEGDAIAQFQLGLSYLEQNRTDEGVDLIRKAANTLPAAQYRLAKLYETGTGVAKDTAMAKQLTERAARAGNRIAMHDLAIYYAYGNGGVDADMGTAAGWFEKAAERGVVDSQFNLAILFENGQGVTPSPSDAYFWYSIASSQGDQTAKARLLALDEIMAPADIEAAKTRVANFTPVAINQEANGIFKNLAWQTNGSNNPQREQVRQVQTLLTEIGFDIGGADGIMGKRTRDAIVSFERSNGMTETGQVSSALIDKLNIAAGA